MSPKNNSMYLEKFYLNNVIIYFLRKERIVYAAAWNSAHFRPKATMMPTGLTGPVIRR